MVRVLWNGGFRTRNFMALSAKRAFARKVVVATGALRRYQGQNDRATEMNLVLLSFFWQCGILDIRLSNNSKY